MLRTTDSLLILVIYMDDLLIIRCLISSIVVVKRILHHRCFMMDMGPLHYFLGIKTGQDALRINIYQAKYARDLMERFHMAYYKSSPTPFLSVVRIEYERDPSLVYNTIYKKLVGSLLYIFHSQPNLSYAVGEVFRYMYEPHELHWNVAKCILQYVQGTISYGIHYA
jgi:hypothetical protein